MESKISRGRVYKRKNLSGLRFGKLVAESYSHDDPNGDCVSIWKCKCDCGGEAFVRIGALSSGRIQSCGCVFYEYDKRNTHPLHIIWTGIKQRCFNQKVRQYNRYGGRGITMFKGWADDYIKFYEDVIGLYVEGLQIDRINNNGNYEPGNIRWVDNKTNMRNRSATILDEKKVLEIRRSTLAHKELAEMFGVKENTISTLRSKNCQSWRGVW
jgi:hypothetical protein